MDLQEPVTTTHEVPSLARALRTLRSAALRAPGNWHESPTRRFGIRVAWRVDRSAGATTESVRVQRALVRPYSEDLIAVSRRLPPAVEVAEVEDLAADRTLILRLRGGGSFPRMHTACGRCQRPALPLQPLFGRSALCAACSTAPSTT